MNIHFCICMFTLLLGLVLAFGALCWGFLSCSLFKSNKGTKDE